MHVSVARPGKAATGHSSFYLPSSLRQAADLCQGVRRGSDLSSYHGPLCAILTEGLARR